MILKWQLADNPINFSKILTTYFSKNAYRISAAIVTDIKSIYDNKLKSKCMYTYLHTYITLKEFTDTNSKAKPIKQKSVS